METPFDKPMSQDEMKIVIDEHIYSGDEILVYFDEIVSVIGSQPPSWTNKVLFLNMIKILRQKREYRRAYGVADEGIRRYPQDTALIRLRIKTLIDLKKYENALENINEYLLMNPFDIDTLLLKAKLFKLTNQDRKEERVLQDILEIPRGDSFTSRGKIYAIRRLGDKFFKEGRYEEALEKASKLVKCSPDEGSWAMYFETLAKANRKDQIQQAREKFARFKRAKAYFEKGTEYELGNKFNLALANYRKGLEIYPDEPMINLKVAHIFMYKKKWYSKAEEFLRKALQLNPLDEIYHKSLVICLKNQGKFREAFEEAKISEQMAPLSNTYYLRSLARKLDKKEEFIQLMKSNIEQDTINEFPYLRIEMGLFFEEINHKEQAKFWFNEAIKIYEEQVRERPGDWEIHLELGNCYKKLHRWEEAEKMYQQAEKMGGVELTDIFESLVDLYQQSNQPDKAGPYLKKLIRKQPGNLVNYVDLGISHLLRITSSWRKKEKEE